MTELQLPLSPELCESLRVLSLKRKQGVLEILAPDREYELTFLDGRIVHADRLDTPLHEFILKRLSDAERKQVNIQDCERKGRSETLEYLESRSGIQHQKLVFLKKQYDRETLLLLSRERSFSFDFRTKIVRCANDISLHLTPGHFILDLLEAAETSGKVALAAAPARDQSVVSPPSPEPLPAVNCPPVEERKRTTKKRKGRRPPKVGRWKEEIERPKSKRLTKSVPTHISSDQIFVGIKLILLLTLVVISPAFFAGWLAELFRFVGH